MFDFKWNVIIKKHEYVYFIKTFHNSFERYRINTSVRYPQSTLDRYSAVNVGYRFHHKVNDSLWIRENNRLKTRIRKSYVKLICMKVPIWDFTNKSIISGHQVIFFWYRKEISDFSLLRYLLSKTHYFHPKQQKQNKNGLSHIMKHSFCLHMHKIHMHYSTVTQFQTKFSILTCNEINAQFLF